MRRLRVNAVGWRRETSAAKSARLSDSRLAGSVTRAVAECRPPSSSGISPSTSPAPHAGDLDRALPGQVQRDRHAPAHDQEHRHRLVALAPEHLARRQLAPAQDPGEVRQLRLRHPVEERDGGEEGDDLRVRAAAASDIQVERLEVEPAGGVSAAVIIEYSGTSSHEDVSTVSGSEAISSERGVSLAAIAEPPSRCTYSPPTVYQRLQYGRSVSSSVSSSGYQP